MRWDNLRIEAEEGARLPGYRDGAVVRRFDAPEALDMRFYEVHAKSALNRVPEASAMPFRWTINPYRGCSHACVYCLSGDTQVLMADGALRPIADLRAGDEIVGTEEAGGARRLVRTTVVDQWSSVKPAYRVTLADGTELVASADHRFLADVGWRHVAGAPGSDGRPSRPQLATEHALVGFGLPGAGAIPDDQYRQGYLCGLLRADPRLGVATRHQRPADPEVHALRRARMAPEALDRAHEYLAAVGIAVDRAALTPTGPLPEALVGSEGVAPALRPLISWPRTPSTAWRQGFLAGTFDAEGSVGGGVLRLTSEDPVMLSWAASSLRHLGFAARREPPWPAVSHEVLVDGGAIAQLRFRHVVGPARPLAPMLDGEDLEARPELRVVSVEPLPGAMRLYDVTTGTGDFIANGVVSHNCFARPTHTYLDFDAGRDFEREIVVKVNVPEVLRAELKRPSWQGEHIAMGTNTDPYQWVEGRYRLMPGIWEALRDFRNPCSVLTKSPLVLRDLPLLRQIAEVAEVSANLSVPTIDEQAWRATEPHTPNPKARLEAVAELNRNGIPTGILVAPLMPGINDDPAQVERIVQTAIEAGATSIGGIGLHLRREVRDVFMDWLRACRPELVEHYEELYARGAYLPPVERKRLAGLLQRAGAGRAKPFRRDPALGQDRGRGVPRPAAAVQEALF